jgi:ketosteroid isomerase-like protein
VNTADNRLALMEAVYAAFNRRDLDNLADLLGLLGSHFEWHPNPEEPEQGVARTREHVLAGVRERWASLERLQTELEHTEVLGDRILAFVRHEAVLQGSTAPIERREVHLWSFAGDEVVSLHEFPTRDAALAALAEG